MGILHTNAMKSFDFKMAFIKDWLAEHSVDEESDLPEVLFLEAVNVLLDILPETDQKVLAESVASESDEEVSRLFQQYYNAHKSQVDSHIQEVIGSITT